MYLEKGNNSAYMTADTVVTQPTATLRKPAIGHYHTKRETE
jgi:hypothetical protein